MGLIVAKLHVGDRSRAAIAGWSIAGLLMPIGIVAALLLGAPPLLVGAVAILIAFAWAGVAGLVAPK